MPKNIIEDVRAPKNQRSIRDVPLSNSKTPRALPRHSPPRRVPDERDNRDNHEERKSNVINLEEDFLSDSGESHFAKYLLWGIVFLCVVVLFLSLSTLFVSATITVTPKSESASVNASVPVDYQTLIVSLSATTSVPAHGQVAVSQKASGQIVIYNNYSAASQILVKNTRFQVASAGVSSGLIYRIANQITIPGKVGSIPGSITVTVYADQPGAKYNIGLSDFTIPGFASSAARYSGFYARSKTIMSGGESGMMPQVTSTDLASAEKTLDGKLTAELIGTAAAGLPSEYVLFLGAATTTFVPTLSNSAAGSTTPLAVKATYLAMVFDRADLSTSLASAAIPKDYAGTPIDISNMTSLQAIASPTDLNALVSKYAAESTVHPTIEQATSSALVSFSGNADFVWQYSSSDLKNALVGTSGSDIYSVLNGFPSIANASVVIRPFWISTLPKNPNKISIVTN